MQVASPFELIAANKVEPGSVVVIKYRQLTPMVALTVQRYEGRDKAFLLLEPTAPDWKGEAGIFEASVLGTADVLRVKEAKAVVLGSLDGATFDPTYSQVPPGALSVTDKGRYLVSGRVATGTSMMWAVDDGREIRPTSQAIWFPTWDIAVPDMNDKLHTLCTVKANAG